MTMRCSICCKSDLDSQVFRDWLTRMKEPLRYHRKNWEFAYIAQVLHERGKLQPGMRGLGFAVGLEPLPSLFASMGCEIVATDLDTSNDPRMQELWGQTDQNASSLRQLNLRGICPAKEFAERVSFRHADMNAVPLDFQGFDFVWSSCAIEHVGSLEKSALAIESMMRCLKPGGIAVHTTEFNLSSNTKTYETGDSVIWRRRDLEKLERRLRKSGHRIEPFDYSLGSSAEDLHVDEVPYPQQIHLKLRLGEYVSSSMGLIIEAKGIKVSPSLWSRILYLKAS